MAASPAILLVEDDAAVRRLLERTLSRHGWKILLAGGGIEALALALQYDGAIPLAIVDLVMPGVGGLDLGNQLRMDRPSTKVLYISGYDSIESNVLERAAPWIILRKPFTAAELLDRVEGLLRGEASGV